MPATLPDDARCRKCGYLLRGLTENRCPECGRPFDPTDLGTVRYIGLSVSTRRWARAPCMAEVIAVLIVAILMLVFRSRPTATIRGEPYFPALWVAWVAPALVWWWGLRVLSRLRWLRLPADSRGPDRRDRRVWRWCVLPLCLAAVVSCAFYEWPQAVRFRLSESALAREASRLQAMHLQDPNSGVYVDYGRWIGLYYVWGASIVPHGRWIHFGVDEPGRGGLAFDMLRLPNCCPGDLPRGWNRYDSY